MEITELKKFKDEEVSKIREMLDYAKCQDRTSLLISALQSGQEDEEVMEAIQSLQKNKANAMKGVKQDYELDEIDESSEPSCSLSSEEPDMRRRERRDKRICDSRIELASYSKNNIKTGKRAESSNELSYQAFQTIEKSRKLQMANLKIQTDNRITEAEETLSV